VFRAPALRKPTTFALGESRALTPLHIVREFALLLAACLAYFGVRGLTEGDAARAVDNAWALIDLERSLGLFREAAMQDALLDVRGLTTLANWVYMWGHWPVIAVIGGWLLFRAPASYYVLRNAFLISGAIGLVIFMVFPVAPPRLTDLGVVDTVTLHSHSYRVLQPPGFVNQYAAVPSLHFGWNLLVGIAIVRQSSGRLGKLLGWAMPVLMWLAVIVTAKHYIIDTVIGAAVALTGLLVARLVAARPSAGDRRWRAPHLQRPRG